MKGRNIELGSIRGCFLGAVLLIFVISPLQAQVVDSQETIILVKEDVVDYLRENDGLEKRSSMQEYERRITIVESVEKTALGYNKLGIYAFGVASSHSKTYLLLKKDAWHKILDPDDLGDTLKSVINFLTSEKVTNHKIISYIESIIAIYRMNENRNPTKLEGKK